MSVLPAGIDPPLQDRARRSYHRMLDATEELLRSRPFDEISVDEIAARAGYTKGAFYHRFPSKAVLLRHLLARLTEGAGAAWDRYLAPDRWAGIPLPDVLTRVIRRLVRAHRRSPHLLRVLDHEVRTGTDEELRGIVQDLNARIATGLERILRDRAEHLPPHAAADPAAAALFWTAGLQSLLAWIYLWPHPLLDADVTRDADAVEERLIDLFVPALTAPASPPSPQP